MTMAGWWLLPVGLLAAYAVGRAVQGLWNLRTRRRWVRDGEALGLQFRAVAGIEPGWEFIEGVPELVVEGVFEGPDGSPPFLLVRGALGPLLVGARRRSETFAEPPGVWVRETEVREAEAWTLVGLPGLPSRTQLEQLRKILGGSSKKV